MWAQTWSNIGNDIIPFPDKKEGDITKELQKQV